MSQHVVYIEGQRRVLTAADLIQAGGEGMVFRLDEDTAVKLYHQPDATRADKLRAWEKQGWADKLPAAVLGPDQLAYGETGQIIGFSMARLPAAARPLYSLAGGRFWKRGEATAPAAAGLLGRIHTTLSELHRLGLVVGDLNDLNLFFTEAGNGAWRAFWIDADSYQFGPYPCPVALLPFLDPDLYGTADFSQQPYFSPRSDWYAYRVLLMRALLGVHPYGGAHPRHKSLRARTEARVSVFDAGVTYPSQARPLHSLGDDLLHHLHQVFAQGQRPPFPAKLLADHAANLVTCGDCGLEYPRERRGCPACRAVAPAPRPVQTGHIRELLAVDGIIELVRVSGERALVVVRQGRDYRLIRLGMGGVVDETPLFSGERGYRFACAPLAGGGPLLAVNPPRGGRLLLLSLTPSGPQQVELVETAVNVADQGRETAVFAATPRHLYRIAGNWIMRGGMQNGHFVEEAIATAHRRQTIFWGSPYSETLAGYHRVFADYHFFLWDEGATHEVAAPAGRGEGHVWQTAVSFTPDTAQWRLTRRRDGEMVTETAVVDRAGNPLPDVYVLSTRLPVDFPLGEGTGLHWHPAGILIREARRLRFCPHRVPSQ